ncbi:MAG: hypothetical protein JWN14_3334 [Chthonomonadales bacterium]|nr:hypothetical protein [Chthonomonadales bacterium]
MKFLKRNPAVVLGCSLVIATTQGGLASQAARHPADSPTSPILRSTGRQV